MNQITRVMIADDHSMVREGIKQLLELDGDIIVSSEANDGKQCIDQLTDIDFDVLLLDVNMPKINGLQVLQHIKQNKVKVKVIILTIHNEVEYLVEAIEYGIEGYILKDTDSSELKKAIQRVMSGEVYIQPELIPLLNSYREEVKLKCKDDNDNLTKREVEVLKLLAEGLFNKEIACRLEISEKTVKNHVSNIFKKLNVSDRTQAAIYAIKNNYVELI